MGGGAGTRRKKQSISPEKETASAHLVKYTGISQHLPPGRSSELQ